MAPPSSNRTGYSKLPDADGAEEPLLAPGSSSHGVLLSHRLASADTIAVLPSTKSHKSASSAFTLLLTLLASLGGLSFGYDQGVIANVLVSSKFLDYFSSTGTIPPLVVGFMTAALELGALAGAVLVGIYGDRFGRGALMTWACLVFIIGGSGQALAQKMWQLVVGRGVGGVGVGMLSTLTPLYISEIAPPHLRGALMSLEQLSIVLGVVLGFWFGFLCNAVGWSWRIPLAVQVTPGVLLGLACISGILPQSPRWLVLVGREAEAEGVLQRLRGNEETVRDEFLEMKAERDEMERMGTLGGVGKAWSLLWSKEYRKRTLIGVTMMAFQQWSGINALLYYGPTLVASLGFSSSSFILSGGIPLAQLAAVFPAIFLIDRVGRRPLLRGGSALMCISHMVVAMLVSQYGTSMPLGAAYTALASMYIFTLSYGLSLGPIAWVLPAEVFPLHLRGLGVALSTASNWSNNFIIGALTPFMVDSWFGAQGTFAVFGCACAGAYVWATYVVRETKGVGLEDMDAIWGSAPPSR